MTRNCAVCRRRGVTPRPDAVKRSYAVFALHAASLAGWSEACAAPATDTLALPAARADDLLLLAVEFDNETLSDALPAHGDPADPLVPVSEFSRLLELDVTVLPEQGLITGRLGESQRPLTIDLKSGEARSGSIGLPIGESDAAVSPNEIFLRASLADKLLPIAIKADADNLILTVTAREKLPLQSRRDRSARLLVLGEAPSPGQAAMQVKSPYRMVSYPAFDLVADIGGDSERGGFARRFEGRVAADLLRTNVTGFLGTDDRGRLASARIKAERRSTAGELLGPLRATYAAAGDVFSPSLALGPRSMGGAGLSVSTAPFEQVSVFEQIDLRGELPLGYDVELYVNDVLRAGQNTATRGRYEFNKVGLVRGINVIRIVSYGPRGERDEETRVINVGGGQVEPGRTVLEAGIVWQDRPVIDLMNDTYFDSGEGRGKPRTVVSLAHGLSTTLTLQAGGAIYHDRRGAHRQVVSAGLRTSIAGFATQFDHAHDFTAGSATMVGIAGRIAGISVVGRHGEYSGGFADENVTYFELDRPLQRYSDLSFDLTVPFLAKSRLPISGRVERAQYRDGYSWVARGRTNLSVADTLVAVGLDYLAQRREGHSSNQLTGSIAASRLVDYKWQLRASADVDFKPHTKLRALNLTADRPISDRHSLRLGLAKSFGEFRDLTLQAGLAARFPFADMSLTGDYSTSQKRWRVGLQLNVGLAFDPSRRSYRLTPPGPASGASAALHAFRDENANGIPDPGEKPVAGIVLAAPTGPVATDSSGKAFVTGLGEGPSGLLRVETNEVDTVFDSAPPENIAFEPRAGNVLKVFYPIVPTSEVAVKIAWRQRDGNATGLAAVRIRLVPEHGHLVEGRTEFDGIAVFEQVKPGNYRLELDPDQAGRLNMRLAAPVSLTVGSTGRIIRIEGEVVFERETRK